MHAVWIRLLQRKLVQWGVAYLAGAWLLLQVLDLLRGTFDWPQAAQQVATVLLGVGFLAALVLAWYHGEKGHQRVTAMELAFFAVLCVVASVGVAFVGGGAREPAAQVDAVSSSPAPTADAHSIAVLPFDNLSTEQENAFFASGLHDEVLTQLTRIGGLKVISRTSVMAYEGSKKTLKQIGAELGAGVVVEGSVQRAGDRVRVQAQLVDARTDQHLWAEKYDRDLTDLFAIQSDIAQRIAGALQVQLAAGEREHLERVPTKSAEAYTLYLRAAQMGGAEAQALYERAIALDPDFALAHARLSIIHGSHHWLELDVAPARVDKQRTEAETALRLQPDLAEAHLAMGLYWYFARRDYPRALEELEIARKSLPSSAEIWAALGWIHRRLGDWDQSNAHLLRAMELDPRSPQHPSNLCGTLDFTRRYVEAARACESAGALAPDSYDPIFQRGWVFVRWQGTLDTIRADLGRLPVPDESSGEYLDYAVQRVNLALWSRRPDEAIRAARAIPAPGVTSQVNYHPRALFLAWAHRSNRDEAAARAAFDSARVVAEAERRRRPDAPGVRIALGFAYAGLGRKREAVAEASKAMELLPESRDAYTGVALAADAATVMAQAGDADGAMRILEDLIRRPSTITDHELRLNPLWDPIRAEPRFQELLAGATAP